MIDNDLVELMARTRTCRRFAEEEPVTTATLRELVALASLGGSARNLQPLKYVLVNEQELSAGIFPHLLWAGYLRDWPGPSPGERPPAYIVCLLDTRIAGEADCDLGIATQNILLGATASGLAGCRIGSVGPKVRRLLKLPDHLKILLIIALGHPREEVVIEPVGPGGDIRYWRDEQQVHHVPKRSLDEIIVKIG
jgi:nitroreductase